MKSELDEAIELLTDLVRKGLRSGDLPSGFTDAMGRDWNKSEEGFVRADRLGLICFEHIEWRLDLPMGTLRRLMGGPA